MNAHSKIEMHPDNKKYVFTGETHPSFPILKRIKRISDNLLGGWITSEDNLSFDGYCFVYDNAIMFNKSKLYGNASMYDNSSMHGNSRLCENARLHGNASMYDNSMLYDNASMHDNSMMRNNSSMYDNSSMHDNSSMYDNTKMHDNARLYDNTKMHDNARLYLNGFLEGRQILTGICKAKFICNLTSIIEGYDKTLNNLNGVAYIAAGCRWFSLKEAKKHWANKPDRVMTLAAMNFASEIAKIHGLVEDESELVKITK